MADHVPAPAEDDGITQIPIDEPLPDPVSTSEAESVSETISLPALVDAPAVEETPEPESEDPPWLKRVKEQEAERKANYKPWFLPEIEQTIPKDDGADVEPVVAPAMVINEDDPEWLKRAKSEQQVKESARQKRKAQPIASGGTAPLPVLFALLLLLLRIFGDFSFHWPTAAAKRFGEWDALQPQQVFAPLLENQQLLMDTLLGGALNLVLPALLMVFILNRKIWARFAYVIVIVGSLVLLDVNLGFNLDFSVVSAEDFIQNNWPMLRNVLPILSAVLVMLPAATPWFNEIADSETS